MAQGSFSSQLKDRQSQQQQGRITRTQRKQQQEKQRIAEYNFQEDQKEAERLRSEVFGTLTFNEYEQEYSKLNPNIQQFFATPTEIKEKQESLKAVEKEKIQSVIDRLNKRIEDRQQAIAQERGYRNRQEKVNKYMDDISEFQDTIKYINQQKSKVDQGASAEDIVTYGYERAGEIRRREDQRTQNAIQFRKDLESGKLDQTISKLGIAKDPKMRYYDYQQAIKGYNQNITYLQNLQKSASRVGIDKLPEQDQQKLLTSLGLPSDTKEIPIFDKKGKLTGVKSDYFKETIPIDQYNVLVSMEKQKEDKFATVDTTLKLGEKTDPKPNFAVMSDGSNIEPFTYEQQQLNRAYADKTLLTKGFDWIKDISGFNEPKQDYRPPNEVVTTTTAPQGMGGKGTVITDVKLDEETKLYTDEMMIFNRNADKLSEEIFADYNAKLKALDISEITPEKISTIKTEQQAKFDDQIKVYSADFDKNFQSGLKKIERSNTISSFDAFGLGGVASFYFKQSDKDAETKAKRELNAQSGFDVITTTTAPQGMGGRGTAIYNYKLIEREAKKLKPSQSDMETEYLRDFTKYSEKKMPDWIARELSGIEQFGVGTGSGFKEGVLNNPRTILFKTGIFAGVVGGATALTTYSSGAGAVAGSKAVKIAGAGLLGLWGGSVLVRTSVAPTTYKRGFTLGDIGAKEILPMIAGGYIGRTVSTKGIKSWENYKTLKQKPEYIAPYKRVRMDVLKGETNFPTEKTAKHLSEFQKAKFSLLTDEKGSKMKVVRQFRVVDDATIKGLKIDFNSGTVRFGSGLTKIQKANMLKNYFGDQYSTKLLQGNRFSLTKYVPKEAWNKYGVSAGGHATTSGRFGKVGERYVAGAGSSEVPAQYFSSEDSLYFALGKGQSTSLYGGSLFGSAVPKPYVESLRAVKTIKIPKGYKPKLTKAQVIEYLKKYAPEYPLETITRSQGSYWKETAYMIERGRTGELIVIGRKSEIEAGKLFGTVAERTGQKPYYTRVASPEIYKDLTKISRLGRTEYVWQVKPLTLKDAINMKTAKFSPLKIANKLDIKAIDKIVKRAEFKIDYPTINPILKYRVGDILMGRQVGQFKSMPKGTIVPIERYKAIPQTTLEKEQHVNILKDVMKNMDGSRTSQTVKQVSAQAIEDQILTQNIKQITEMNILSSSSRLPKSSLTFAEEYGSMISFPKKSYTYKTPSYSSSPSLKSSIKSLISSGDSSVKSSGSSYSGSSPSFSYSSPSYDYSSGSSYTSSSVTSSSRSVTSTTNLILASLKSKIKKVGKKKPLSPDAFALLPDFTSRAIGLKPQEFGNVESAMKEIRALKTGFEIRRGGKIRGVKAFDEKQIMMGIMK